jgi:hypothetical protein
MGQLLEVAVLAFLGGCAGVLSGCFGVGGAFVITPLLHALGHPMTFSVGMGIAYTSWTSALAGVRYLRGGSASKEMFLKVVLPMGICTFFTTAYAKNLALALDMAGKADGVIRAVYVILLILSGTLVLRKKALQEGGFSGNGLLRLPPLFRVQDLDVPVSVWNVLFVGLLVGFLQGFLGIGGGSLMVPLLVALCAFEAHLAVAVSLLVIMITAPYGAVLYFFAGKISLVPLMALAVGAWFGSALGVRVNRVLPEHILRRALAGFFYVGSLAMALKAVGWHILSLVLLLGLAVGAAGALVVVGIVREKRGGKN